MSQRVECAHNSYWRGVYGTCIVCRADRAVADLADAMGSRVTALEMKTAAVKAVL